MTNRQFAEKYRWIIWDMVWKKAQLSTKGKRLSEDGILGELAAELGINGAHSNLWRYLRREDQMPNASTIRKFLLYLEYEDQADFHNKYVAAGKGVDYDVRPLIGQHPFLEAIREHLFTREGVLKHAAGPVLTEAECARFFKLVQKIRECYTENVKFNSIRLLADEEGRFGYLPMDGDFVQLSYISQSEARTRDAVSRSEAEQNITKIRRSIANNQKISKDYIVNYHFNDIRQLLILGSPGVGKSTFSRWHCYEWIQNPQRINTVPVYIELKQLDFSSRNPLLAYVHREYGDKGKDPDELHAMLRKSVSAICFILDGYDELSETNKQQLENALVEIAPGCRYLLTSRPYGILNTYGLSFTEMIQLDGLDMANIHRYIDNFLKKDRAGRSASKEQLLRIIDANSTLADFAHNPLFLSFMVVIYLSDDNAEAVLKNIQSRFDLQHTVANWILQHNAVEVPADLYEKAAGLAYNMELGKCYEQTGRQYDDPALQQAFTAMSRYGLGQMVKDAASDFRFYFSSVSFQEYFAAMAVRRKITADGFCYLLRDAYFWNLCAMMAGSIQDVHLLSAVVKQCEKDIARPGAWSEDYYKYVLLLSECTSDFLDFTITREKLEYVYHSYRINRQENESLVAAVGECILRLYKKLSFRYKTVFKKIIVDSLRDFLANNADDELELWNEQYSHIPGLVDQMGFREDTSFCVDISDLLISMLRKLNRNDALYEEDLSEVLLDIIITHHPVRPVSDTQYIARLEKINELLPVADLLKRTNVQLHYVSTAEAISGLYRLADYMKAGLSQKQESLAAELITLFYIVARRSVSDPDLLALEADQHIFGHVADLLFDYLEKRGREEKADTPADHIFHYTDLVQLTVTAFFELNDFSRTEQALSLIERVDGLDDIEFELANKETILAYFGALIDKIDSPDTERYIGPLLKMIHHIPALKNKIALCRDNILLFIQRFLKKHDDIFQKIKDAHVAGQPGDAGFLEKSRELDIVCMILPFFNLMKGDDYKIYESDKHYFIRNLLAHGLDRLPYFKRHILKDVFADRINIYDKLYWDAIISCLEDEQDEVIANALFVCTNESIYSYVPNLEYLGRVLDIILTSILQWKKLQSYIPNIMYVVAHTLLLIRKKNVKSALAEHIVACTGRILEYSPLRKAAVKTGIAQWYQGQQAAFIMQYYFTGESSFDLQVNYFQRMNGSGNEMGCDHLLEALYDSFTHLDGILRQADLELIETVAGEEIAFLLNEMTDNFSFSKTEFEQLCN